MSTREQSGISPKWLILPAIGFGLAAVALLGDQRCTNWLTNPSVHAHLAEPLQIILGAGGLIVLLAILNTYPNRYRLWVGLLLPMILSTATTHLLKWIIGRGRPKFEAGPFHFEPFTPGAPLESFPSGHTSGAVTLALVLCVLFPRSRGVFILLAVLAGLDRIVKSEHYLSDVLAGAALGGLCVWICMRLLGPRYYQKELPPAAK